MKIDLPCIAGQQKFIYEQSTREGIKQLEVNLRAPHVAPQTEIDENLYPRTHLLRESEGWEPPHADICGAYFRHFQKNFPEFNTDAKLAKLLGLSTDRRVRAFKDGSKTAPYNVWRKFLIMTGRAPQEIFPVLAFMG